MKFIPTGGVNYDNMNEYLDLPNVAAVGGSFITPSDLVKAKDWDAIAAHCQKKSSVTCWISHSVT